MSEHDKKLRTEVSAGGIVFQRSEKGILIAFILDPFNKWTFAKGHVEPGEKSETAAMREVEEETGLKDIKFIEGFKRWIKYFFRWEGKNILKFVTFYLVETKTKEIKISEEHMDYKWLPYEQALNKLTFKNAKETLKKADGFFKKSL